MEWIEEMLREEEIEEYLTVEDVKRVYQRLVEVARAMKITFYSKVMEVANLSMDNAYEREQVLGKMLGGMSKYTYEKYGIFISSLVVRKPNLETNTISIPSDGFFRLLEGYGYNFATQIDKMSIWLNELRKVWKFFSKDKGVMSNEVSNRR